MAIYRLDRDLVVQRGDTHWAVQRILDNRYVQLEEPSTGRIRKERIAKLHNDIVSGLVSIVGGKPASHDESTAQNRQVIFSPESLSEQHRAAYDRAHDYVRAMRKRGISQGQRNLIAAVLPLISESLGDAHPPKPSTVMRWMRIYQRSDRNSMSLVSGHMHRRHSRLVADDVRVIIDDILKQYYFIKNGCSVRTAHDRIVRALERRKPENEQRGATEPVSLSTVRRIALETSPFDRDRLRLGAATARAKWRYSKPGVIATRPLERVEMDHTPLDIYVIDDQLGIPLGRPILTLMICSYSAYIIGFYISFEGESLARMIRTIKIAIQPKDSITAHAKLRNPWYGMGVWETLVLDNPLAAHAPPFKQIALDLGFDIEYCPVRMPWFKPVVERYIGEACRQLPPQGRPQPPGRSADPVNPKLEACVTFNDLCEGLLRWVVDVHPFQINQQKLARPVDLFLEGLDKCPAPTFVDSYGSLNVLAGISKQVSVRRGAIGTDYIRYTNNALRDLGFEMGTNFKTTIKYDPNDLGEIHVMHPKTKMWFRVPAKDLDYACGLSATQHKAIRAAAKEKLTAANAQQVLRESKLALQDFYANAVLSGKKLKRSAKEYCQLSGHKSIPSPSTIPAAAADVLVDEYQPDVVNEIPTFGMFSVDDL
ncbi:MAG: Mu transposase C-terminal domain-containing protein [Pseudomonadota bacterium]|nr:Mu transposase C-terminal domain-containing protein [Pseudomonadota bacterium]